MLMQHLKEIVVNRETASYERARDKERKGQILGCCCCCSRCWRETSQTCNGCPPQPFWDLISSYLISSMSLSGHSTVSSPWETLKSGNIQIKIIIFFAIEIKIIRLCSTIWEYLLANYSWPPTADSQKVYSLLLFSLLFGPCQYVFLVHKFFKGQNEDT